MSFIRYVARKLVGLPPSDGLEVVEAMRYSSPAHLIASSRLFYESPYDLASREFDHRTYGAISPTLKHEDCLSSAELEKAAADVYKSLEK